MGAFRTLIILVAVFVTVWLLRRKLTGRARRRRNAGRGRTPEEMRVCAHCRTHAPVTAGVLAGKTFYCCEEHRRAAEKT